ncbi:1-acyl-sn-glycerol-3-phosphate acyltransferase [Isoptericola sp. NEAU-Y5]|uniref:1-acyl-sn-glycerol-3-phosphate acyltransferase n=1 Tax=Isoptericola luteus TaxID=2879484 RepID=A0ABS7ZCN9_9MICO|nr:1-acyl-sn-glycerol-3-phosphate acyltransferase [Isoptericola sp. NEAU-Y5]MCA5892802.1 1-acyl-sn-glycerol-3-phosphate acyltransferase [Isoptericola sp. NEAU-Y5]
MIAPPPRWVRRIVVAPLVVLLAVVLVPTTLMLALVVGAALTWILPGRLRVLRMLWMLGFYVVWDAAALVALFLLWVASGFGLALDRPLMQRAHVTLARIMLAVLFWQVRWTLRLMVLVEAPSDAELPQVPLVVLSRHAGPGDSFILLDALLGLARRTPAVVLKDTLQWDPAVDVLLHRLPAAFVTPRSRRRPGQPGATESVAHIARELGARGALVLFPEGGNVTPRRRTARIEKLRATGHDALAARAEQLPHVMAPHVGGYLAVLDNVDPDAAVLVVAHTGLERLVTVRDIWRELPMDKTIALGGWVTRLADLPADRDGRELWLFEQWERVDGWIARRTPDAVGGRAST